MKILQVDVNKPSFSAFTRAAAVSTIIFVAILGCCALVGYQMPDARKALTLAAIFCGPLSREMGVKPEIGWRHAVLMLLGALIVYLAVCGLLFRLSQ